MHCYKFVTFFLNVGIMGVCGHRLGLARRARPERAPREREQNPEMKSYDEIKHLTNPEVFHLACGHTIPNVRGQKVWNYYDMVWETVTHPDARPDIDTSGQLPGGVTYWFCSVDNSRATCVPCGEKQEIKHAAYIAKRDAERRGRD